MNWDGAQRKDATYRPDTTNHRLERYAERWLARHEAILCEESTIGRKLTKREKAEVNPKAWFHDRRHENDTLDPRDRMKQKPPPAKAKRSKKAKAKSQQGKTRR